MAKRIWIVGLMIAVVAIVALVFILPAAVDTPMPEAGQGALDADPVRLPEGVLVTAGGPVRAVDMAPDYAAAGDDTGTVRVWNIADMTASFRFQAHEGPVSALAFAPDGETLAIAGPQSDTITLWDVGRQKPVIILDSEQAIQRLVFNPSGQFLAAGTADSRILIYDLFTSSLLRTLSGHTAMITALAFSPDGQWLVSGSADSTLRIWQTATWRKFAVLDRHSAAITALAFSPNSSKFASASTDLQAFTWQSNSFERQHTLTGYPARVNALVLLPDRLITGGQDGLLRVQAVHSGETLHRIEGDSPLLALAYQSAEGSSVLLSGAADGTIQVHYWP